MQLSRVKGIQVYRSVVKMRSVVSLSVVSMMVSDGAEGHRQHSLANVCVSSLS